MRLATLALAVLTGACSTIDKSVTGADRKLTTLRGSGIASIGETSLGNVGVCKWSGLPGTYTFHVDVTGGGAYALPNGADVTLDFDGSLGVCKDAYVPVDDGSWTDGAKADVKITEINIPYNQQVLEIKVYDPYLNGPGNGGFEASSFNTNTRTVSVDRFQVKKVIFLNGIPKTRTPGALKVCKVSGPAGSYTFQVSVSGGGAYTLPNGTSASVVFDGSNAACVVMYVPATDETWPAGTTANVTVSEINIPTDLKVGSIVVTINGTAGAPILNTASTTVVMGFTDFNRVDYNNVRKPPQFCSYTPGGWFAPPNGGNVASKLKASFTSVYPSGATVGLTGLKGYYYATFTTSTAVQNFSLGGTPGVLTHSYTNPLVTEAGEFLSQTLALKFNVNFSVAGIIKPGFATTTVVAGPLAGLTPVQILALANSALAGKTSVLTPYGITVKELTSILGSINQNYDNCTSNNGYLQ